MTMELSCLWFATFFIRLLDSTFCVRDKGVEINSSPSAVFINYILNTSRNKINCGMIMIIPCDIPDYYHTNLQRVKIK